MPKYAAYRRRLRGPLFRLFVRDTKVARDATKIAFGHLDSIIGATIRRALRAIEHHPQRTRVLLTVPITYSAHPQILRLNRRGKSETAFYHATTRRLQRKRRLAQVKLIRMTCRNFQLRRRGERLKQLSESEWVGQQRSHPRVASP